MNRKSLFSSLIFFPFFLVLFNSVSTRDLIVTQFESDTLRDSLSNFNFPELSNWSRTDTIEKYYRNNLYDHIDGAADLFLTYDFQEVQVAAYLRKDSASVIVEVYRFQSPLHAFGMYSQERPPNAHYLNIGTQAYLESPVMNFIVGSCYVKINSFGMHEEAESTLRAYAAVISTKIGGALSLPPDLNYFPLHGKKANSEKYFAHSLLGYELLHSGYVSDYSDGRQEFQIFLIDGSTSEECRRMLESYLHMAKRKVKAVREGNYDVKDPNYGDVTVCWRGKYIYGILSMPAKSKRAAYLKEMEEIINQSEKRR